MQKDWVPNLSGRAGKLARQACLGRPSIRQLEGVHSDRSDRLFSEMATDRSTVQKNIGKSVIENVVNHPQFRSVWVKQVPVLRILAQSPVLYPLAAQQPSSLPLKSLMQFFSEEHPLDSSRKVLVLFYRFPLAWHGNLHIKVNINVLSYCFVVTLMLLQNIWRQASEICLGILHIKVSFLSSAAAMTDNQAKITRQSIKWRW